MLESTLLEAGFRARVFGELSRLPIDITEVDSSIRRYRARFRNPGAYSGMRRIAAGGARSSNYWRVISVGRGA